MLLAACGEAADSGSSETTAPSDKQTAVGVLIDDGKVVADVTIDISKGYSVAFDWSGISLFEGGYSNLKSALVSIVALADGSYEQYIASNKDNKSFQEADGIISFVDSLDNLNYMFMLDDKVPVLIFFDKNIDKEKADELMAGIDMSSRQ